MPNSTTENLTKRPLSQLIDELQAELTKLKAMRHLMGDPGDLVREALAKTPGAARQDLVSVTKLAPRHVSRVLEDLQASGEAVHFGDRRGSRWFLTTTLESLTKP